MGSVVDSFHHGWARSAPGGFRCRSGPAISGRTMTLTLTSILAALFLGTALLAAWRGARPPNPLKGPRMVPWRLLMLTSFALAMLMLVHVLNLAGVATGRGQS